MRRRGLECHFNEISARLDPETPKMTESLPKGWVRTTLGEVCAINPRISSEEMPSDDADVSFVPMSAVEEETGRIDTSEFRSVGAVRRGYTPFKDGDVLFAKITPCMENGKIALASGLKNGLGFGSTEFVVFRSFEGLRPRFLLYFLLQPSFRDDAEQRMVGASGQKRVPTAYLAGHEFRLPPPKNRTALSPNWMLHSLGWSGPRAQRDGHKNDSRNIPRQYCMPPLLVN